MQNLAHDVRQNLGDQINCRRAAVGQRDLENVSDGAEMQPMLEKCPLIRHEPHFCKKFLPQLHILPSIYLVDRLNKDDRIVLKVL